MKCPKIVLFAKSPRPGQVKTRLTPPLSDEQACKIAGFLIRRSVENVSQNWPGEVELSIWPGCDEDMIALASRHGIETSIQGQGDLGEKMHTAIASGVDQGQAVAILGCDVPHCPAGVFQRCFDYLASGDNVIGPSKDGGYYLIGVNQHHPDMFAGVEWGTNIALQQTLTSCSNAGIEFGQRLCVLRDLDSYDDLQALSVYDPQLKQFLAEQENTQ